TRSRDLVNCPSQALHSTDHAATSAPPRRAALETTRMTSALQWIALAGKEIGEDLLPADIVPSTAPPAGFEKRQRFKAGPLPGEAQVKLVWLPMDPSTLRLCWQVELTRRIGGERFRVLVDVQNGQPVLRRRLTLYLSDATFR